MTTSTPFFIGKLPWQSRGVMGSLVAIIAFLLQLKGWHVDQGKLIDDLTQIIGLIGAIIGLYGRIKADSPIVWTRGTLPGGAFNPEAEVRKAEAVQPPAGGPLPSSIDPRRSSGGYAYPGALCVLVACMIAAAVMMGCAPQSKEDGQAGKAEVPIVHHADFTRSKPVDIRPIAVDFLRSLRVSPSLDVTTNRSGQSIPVVTINLNGGVDF